MGRGGNSVARFLEHRNTVLETLAGYAAAGAVVEQERADRLARMSPEEARAMYSDLCRSQAGRQGGGDVERAQRRRLEMLLAVRRVMARLARGGGDGE